MTLKNIVEELEKSEKPVWKMLRQGTDFNVLGIGFKKGMTLHKHKSDLPARIVVLKGEVVYNNDNSSTTLGMYEEYEIPVGEMHSVDANEDSLMIVIKGHPKEKIS